MKIASILGLSLLLAPVLFAAEEKPASVLDFTVTDNAGKEAPLKAYEGKVLLIVNTASKCGYTPQYAGLQKLYDAYKDRGLVVLAFPANNFNQQEPGTDADIRKFCTERYSVTFPLFAKISVKGNDIAPLYAFLTSPDTNPQFSGDIPWNFTKFLVGKDGKVIARFGPKTKPEDKDLVDAIEKAL